MIARIRFSVTAIRAAIPAVDKPRLGQSTIIGFRPDLATLAARRAAIERLGGFRGGRLRGGRGHSGTQVWSIDDMGVMLEHNRNIDKKNSLRPKAAGLRRVAAAETGSSG